MEANEVDVLATAMFCDLEQIENSKKSRFAREFWRNVWEPDRFDGINFDGAFVHGVSVTNQNMRTGPKTDAAGDFSVTNSFPKSFGKYHVRSDYQHRSVLSLKRMLRQPGIVQCSILLHFRESSYAGIDRFGTANVTLVSSRLEINPNNTHPVKEDQEKIRSLPAQKALQLVLEGRRGCSNPG